MKYFIADVLTSLSIVLCLSSQSATAQLRYDQEYPAVGYSTAAASDPMSRLLAKIDGGQRSLEYREPRGYLDDLLAALDIDPSTQILVFSKTSLKLRFITAATPRAVYFNDSVYVAWIQGSSSVEIAAMDPNLGPVFYVLTRSPEGLPETERVMNRCLRCHDSYGLSGGGVPRFLMSSNLVDADGEIVTHEQSQITDARTPLAERWGGWYVSGRHGSQTHLGNLVIRDPAMLSHPDVSKTGNITDLSSLLNIAPYLSPHSDIVALLVVEHQIAVQNLLTRLNFEARTLLADNDAERDPDAAIAELSEPLVRALLMVDEAPLNDRISGTSGFSEYFQRLGPRDSQGRSLRELDLVSRTFRYPLSYLVYSEAFAALPQVVRQQVYARLHEELAAGAFAARFSHISAADKAATLAIVKDTLPDFPR
ncbi:MAG: hypothetical protein RQ899_11585 [Pseudomonadales bacterium]|nr:hypothetical protein [Pseudomonadales bacterium]